MSRFESSPPIEYQPPKEKRLNELVWQAREVLSYLSNILSEDNSSKQFMTRELSRKLEDVLHDNADSVDTTYLRELSQSHPALFEIYVQALREVRKIEESEIQAKFDAVLKNVAGNPEGEREFAEKTLFLKAEITEKQKETLREDFPSGNFLFHTASIKNMLNIIESGAVLTSVEVAKRKNTAWGRGGGEGISFNANDVRILTEDSRHLAGFLIAPETALNQHTKLVVPESAAVFELRLVPTTYKRVYVRHVEPEKKYPCRWNYCREFLLKTRIFFAACET